MLDQLRGAGISIQDEDEDTKVAETSQLCKVKQSQVNSVYGWGRNEKGELSADAQSEFTVDPLPLSLLGSSGALQILKVAAGNNHVLMITKGNQLYAMGSNEFGQLGISDLNCSALSKPSLINDLVEPQEVYCGADSSYCITLDGNLYSWGCNL